jgi:hypothetical protein
MIPMGKWAFDVIWSVFGKEEISADSVKFSLEDYFQLCKVRILLHIQHPLLTNLLIGAETPGSPRVSPSLLQFQPPSQQMDPKKTRIEKNRRTQKTGH